MTDKGARVPLLNATSAHALKVPSPTKQRESQKGGFLIMAKFEIEQGRAVFSCELALDKIIFDLENVADDFILNEKTAEGVKVAEFGAKLAGIKKQLAEMRRGWENAKK